MKPKTTAKDHLLPRTKRIKKTGAIHAAIQTGLSVLNIESENAINAIIRYIAFISHLFLRILCMIFLSFLIISIKLLDKVLNVSMVLFKRSMYMFYSLICSTPMVFSLAIVVLTKWPP